MQTSRFANRALVLAATALAVSTSACSRADLSAAERRGTVEKPAEVDSLPTVRQTLIPADSSALFSVAPAQTRAQPSVAEILKSSPLKNPKADCATPVSGEQNPLEIGTQCPTDLPAKKP